MKNNADKKIETADELEFAVFCIENVAARLHVHAEAVYRVPHLT